MAAASPAPSADSPGPVSNSPRQVSDRRRAANRANAKKSTGPRTPGGKARSRLNGLKHGPTASVGIDGAINADAHM